MTQSSTQSRDPSTLQTQNAVQKSTSQNTTVVYVSGSSNTQNACSISPTAVNQCLIPQNTTMVSQASTQMQTARTNLQLSAERQIQTPSFSRPRMNQASTSSAASSLSNQSQNKPGFVPSFNGTNTNQCYATTKGPISGATHSNIQHLRSPSVVNQANLLKKNAERTAAERGNTLPNKSASAGYSQSNVSGKATMVKQVPGLSLEILVKRGILPPGNNVLTVKSEVNAKDNQITRAVFTLQA